MILRSLLPWNIIYLGNTTFEEKDKHTLGNKNGIIARYQYSSRPVGHVEWWTTSILLVTFGHVWSQNKTYLLFFSMMVFPEIFSSYIWSLGACSKFEVTNAHKLLIPTHQKLSDSSYFLGLLQVLLSWLVPLRDGIQNPTKDTNYNSYNDWDADLGILERKTSHDYGKFVQCANHGISCCGSDSHAEYSCVADECSWEPRDDHGQ